MVRGSGVPVAVREHTRVGRTSKKRGTASGSRGNVRGFAQA